METSSTKSETTKADCRFHLNAFSKSYLLNELSHKLNFQVLPT